MKIGLTYVKGSLPGYETFGNLPTDIVKSNGLVNGVKAHKELDMLIIPGGSILESGSITGDLSHEIKKIANGGGLIVGIGSGFQVLSDETDVGRKSPQPIIKKGLGLLDVNFSPLISNDKVEAFSKNNSILTNKLHNITDGITGFHCHTYGKIENNETPILYSRLKRVNYSNTDNHHLSSVKNDDGNVIGTMIHGILDNNPLIVDNILDHLGVSSTDKTNINNRNKEFLSKINSEIAIDSNIKIQNSSNNNNNPIVKYIKDKNKENRDKCPLTLMIGGTTSDSGKTFITTGIAGNLRKLGLKIAILKTGPDIRDTVPSLYLTKGPMEDFASIKLGDLGWVEIASALEKLKNSSYDFVIVEGAMSILIGILKDIIPYSGAEIATSSNIPVLLASSVNKSGIESSAVDLVAHTKILNKIGIDVGALILNKVYDMNIFNNTLSFIKKEVNVNDIIAIPKIKMDERSSTPEIEINLEDFTLHATNTVDKYLNLEQIVKIAKNPEFNRYLSNEDINLIFKS